MFALVDCNNFFCSCERVFNPQLRGKPVVVLSNNDGCVIARSNEAKALGIKMGAPYYQVRDFMQEKGVAVFSSNYILYGDMSRRVMTLLSEYTPDFAQYSIDEAFLGLDGLGEGEELVQYARQIRERVIKGTDIPVTIGIAPTKTLAKVASKYGKNYKGYGGVCMIDTEEKRIKALRSFDVADVWGIGRRHRELLYGHGVRTALDLTERSESWVRKMLTVTGVRTWKELRGISCIDLNDLSAKQSICTSRSFPDRGIYKKEILVEAVANFAAACVRKLKEQHECCSRMTVFAYTSRFRSEQPQSVIYQQVQFPTPTNSLHEIVGKAAAVLRNAFPIREEYGYKKVGVILWDMVPDEGIQTSLFDECNRVKMAQLQKAMDDINRRNGDNTVRLAIQGGCGSLWKEQRNYVSPSYTTDIRAIIRVNEGKKIGD
ncbi:MAG: Y-family DNA polymerase [Bacteroidetes bacterium]|uniref:Y-family DNA polymerase n=1 Tax=Candidatus Gallipaludibacter merdavium TaxID=2840839 RepID=A0A9D9N3Q2_9BACT|nr:Y-family DNA polymerase [Candidatus Gallipaludibacter merdavium]